MGETENNILSPKLRISKPAVASLTLGILGFLIFLSRFFIFVFPDSLDLLLSNIMGVLGICGFIFGIATVFRISRLATVLAISAVAILLAKIAMSNPFIHSDSFRALMRAMLLAGALLMFAAGVVCFVVSKARGLLKHGIVVFVGLLLSIFVCLCCAEEYKKYLRDQFRARGTYQSLKR
jgi:hypothetical protein